MHFLPNVPPATTSLSATLNLPMFKKYITLHIPPLFDPHPLHCSPCHAQRTTPNLPTMDIYNLFIPEYDTTYSVSASSLPPSAIPVVIDLSPPTPIPLFGLSYASGPLKTRFASLKAGTSSRRFRIPVILALLPIPSLLKNITNVILPPGSWSTT